MVQEKMQEESVLHVKMDMRNRLTVQNEIVRCVYISVEDLISL